jgi:putative ABC transport system ATP-binding protein
MARRGFQAEQMPATGYKRGATGSPLITIEALDKVFPTAAGDIHALKAVNLAVEPGEYVGILGPSGAGKTTLLSMVTGVDHPTRGRVLVNGTKVHRLSEDALARWRGLNIGVIYQSFHLMPTLSLLENVLLPMDLCGLMENSHSTDRAMQLLDSVGLAEHARKKPAAISGGQRQRVAIARALANDPPIIVADEPTGRLDSNTAEQIFTIFRQLTAEQHKTLLLVSHDRGLARQVDRVLHLEDGRLSQRLPLEQGQ